MYAVLLKSNETKNVINITNIVSLLFRRAVEMFSSSTWYATVQIISIYSR
jgi:hypothetical protein